MSIDRVVCNASPLIILFKSGRADLVGELWNEVIVPESVWQEVVQSGKGDAAAQGLRDAHWAQVTEVPVIDPVVAAWDLGDGEVQAISFALQNPGYRAMIDDAQARACASGT